MKIKRAIALLAFVLAIYSFSSRALATTYTTDDASYAAVKAKLDLAKDGDTIIIKPGTVTWNSTLDITKAVYIIGSGMTKSGTFITNGLHGSLFHIHPTNDLPVRLSNLWIDMTNEPHAQFAVRITGKATQVRVDHIYFDQGDWGIGWNSTGENPSGVAEGVIDHCTFNNMLRCLSPGDLRSGDNSIDGSYSWAHDAIQPGTIHNMYVEDNTFTYDSSWPQAAYCAAGGCGQMSIYGSAYGGSAAIRYNTFKNYNAQYLDAHGDAGGQMSTKFFEVYGNTFSWGPYGGGGGTFVGDQRGGTWLVWGNTINSGGGISVSMYCGNYGNTVKNSYFWANSNKDIVSVLHPTVCGTVTDPVENVNYWQDRNPVSGAQQTGVGSGTFAARPTSCSVGTAFWATDQGAGTLYKCTSTNTWTLFYTPYVYPHPLVTGNTATVPLAPKNFHAVII